VLLRNLANRLYGKPLGPVQLSALLPQLPGQLQYLRERVTGNDQLHHKARLQPSTAAQHTACLLRVLALPEVQAQLESQQQLQELVQEVTQAQQQFEALCSSSAGAAPGGQQQGCAQPPALLTCVTVVTTPATHASLPGGCASPVLLLLLLLAAAACSNGRAHGRASRWQGCGHVLADAAQCLRSSSLCSEPDGACSGSELDVGAPAAVGQRGGTRCGAAAVCL